MNHLHVMCEDVCEVFREADCRTIFRDPLICKGNERPVNRERFIENVFIQTVTLFDGHLHTSLTLMYATFKINLLLQEQRQLELDSKLLTTGAAENRQMSGSSELKIADCLKVKSDDAGKFSADSSKYKERVKECRKSLKALLKLDVNRNNIALWDKYARFEWQVSNVKEVRRVLDTAIQLHSQVKVTDITDRYQQCLVLQLYRTFASLELGLVDVKVANGAKLTCDKSRCLIVLVLLVEGTNSSVESLSSPRLLKCRRLYESFLEVLLQRYAEMNESHVSEAREYMSFAGNPLVHWVACFAMFLYLTTGASSASELLQNVSEKLVSLSCKLSNDLVLDPHFESNFLPHAVLSKSSSTDAQLPGVVAHYQQTVRRMLKEFQIDLLYYHVMCHNASQNTLRQPLMHALTEFRSHSHFLEILIDLETGSHIAGRLNKYFTGCLYQATTSSRVLDNHNAKHSSAQPTTTSIHSAQSGNRNVVCIEQDDKLASSLFAAFAMFKRMHQLDSQEINIHSRETG